MATGTVACSNSFVGELIQDQVNYLLDHHGGPAAGDPALKLVDVLGRDFPTAIVVLHKEDQPDDSGEVVY